MTLFVGNTPKLLGAVPKLQANKAHWHTCCVINRSLRFNNKYLICVNDFLIHIFQIKYAATPIFLY